LYIHGADPAAYSASGVKIWQYLHIDDTASIKLGWADFDQMFWR
jgi:hypothetical protein